MARLRYDRKQWVTTLRHFDPLVAVITKAQPCKGEMKMNQPNFGSATRWTTSDLAKTAIVAGLYVAVTLCLAPFSFGAVQLRVAEMFNYLALFNKRNIWAVTIGVAIANLASPNGLIDVVVGSICTLLVLLINQKMTAYFTDLRIKMLITAVIFAISMFTVAGQLTILYQAPFFYNWLWIGIGELLSMTLGGIVIYQVHQKIDLSK